jgi:hypothetical protein
LWGEWGRWSEWGACVKWGAYWRWGKWGGSDEWGAWGRWGGSVRWGDCEEWGAEHRRSQAPASEEVRSCPTTNAMYSRCVINNEMWGSFLECSGEERVRISSLFRIIFLVREEQGVLHLRRRGRE